LQGYHSPLLEVGLVQHQLGLELGSFFFAGLLHQLQIAL
jgi:hypothetical protein